MALLLMSRLAAKRILTSPGQSPYKMIFGIGSRAIAANCSSFQEKSRILTSPNMSSQMLAGMLASRAMSKHGSLQEIDLKPGETHDDKNLRLGRPCAPHLTIYAAQATSMLSIIHRITGFAFSMYLFAFALCALGLPYCFEEVICMVEDYELHPMIIHFCRFAMAFPIVYHTINGIRHLSWDYALFMSMKGIYTTGAIMLTLVVATLGAVLMTYT